MICKIRSNAIFTHSKNESYVSSSTHTLFLYHYRDRLVISVSEQIYKVPIFYRLIWITRVDVFEKGQIRTVARNFM